MATAATSAADFSCSICFETATEPVVTRCGHLFCWPCLDQWLRRPEAVPECPVCKGRVDEHVEGDIIPLYGKGARAQHRHHEQQQSQQHTTGSPCNAAPRTSTATRPPPPTAAAAAATTTAASAASSERPRPAAPRAPTPPREHGNVFGHAGMRGAVPLQMGSFFFVCGGGMSMWLMSIMLFLWGIYRFAPWQRWIERGQRYVRTRLHGRHNSNSNNNNNNNNARATGAAAASEGAAHGEAHAAAHDAPVVDAEAMLRNVCLGFFVACFLYVLLLV